MRLHMLLSMSRVSDANTLYGCSLHRMKQNPDLLMTPVVRHCEPMRISSLFETHVPAERVSNTMSTEDSELQSLYESWRLVMSADRYLRYSHSHATLLFNVSAYYASVHPVV